ncbi:MBL fold metallo-hydrolase [Nonomuraea sp. NPDC049695]|uniref:MBL fold metallo-hydrolase n=1 Tax=Nonomuraea sp. NPDC049695 TaxID=3154734 RepID=UPI0034348F35
MTSWTAGDLTIHRVDETELPAPTGPWLLPDATPGLVRDTPWLRDGFADDTGTLRLSTHSFAFTTGGLRVLVDTGIGNGKRRANPAWHDLNTPYLSRLAAAGYTPGDIDLVILTHLHTDHVGWNTLPDQTPTFPNARYVTSRAEWDYWASVDMDEPRRAMFRDSVHPIRDAGLLDLVDVPPGGVEVAPGVRLDPTPGHTPGHVAVRAGTALITGDCVHHPVQLRHPAITSCVDVDPPQAVATRRRLLATLAGTGTLLLGSHFAPPTGGRVEWDGDTFTLVTRPPAAIQGPGTPGAPSQQEVRALVRHARRDLDDPSAVTTGSSVDGRRVCPESVPHS